MIEAKDKVSSIILNVLNLVFGYLLDQNEVVAYTASKVLQKIAEISPLSILNNPIETEILKCLTVASTRIIPVSFFLKDFKWSILDN